MTITKHRTNRRNAPAAIGRRERFSNSGKSFSGGYQLEDYADHGKLPEQYRDSFRAAVSIGTYVIYSFKTPIAWFDHVWQEWVIPQVYYSRTSSAHQMMARRSVED